MMANFCQILKPPWPTTGYLPHLSGMVFGVYAQSWISHCFFAITIRDSLRWKSYGTFDLSCVITLFLWFTVRCWFLGNTIISIKSVFSDCQNDRIWEFGCGYNAASTTRGRCHWDHGYVNDPKKGIIFKCPNDGFIAGNRPRLNPPRRHNWSVVHSEVTTFFFAPLASDQFSKIPKVSQSNHYTVFEISCKRPPLVSDRNHFQN